MPGPNAKKTTESLAAQAARFLTDPRLKEPLERLAPLANDIKSGRRNVSNLRVGEHSYVDLVVEGGGVLGIALVGYTWALEQAGLRFRHIGGASAGAIVALLLAALGSKDEEKSLRIVAELASFDLATLEDGDLPGRMFKFVRRAGPLTRLAALMVLAAMIFGPIVLGCLFGWPMGGLLLLLWFADLTFLGGLVWWVLRRRGVNSGTAFTAWMTDVLYRHGVQTTGQLEDLLGTPPPDVPDPEGERWKAELKLITAELCAESKVVLPKDSGRYWADPRKVDPAQLLRASMSIPFFFQPATVDEPSAGGAAKDDEAGRVRHPVFVDGGLVSNFPISEFHRDDGVPPAAPTLGVRLVSYDERRREAHPQPPKNVVRFIAALFNTARFALDRSFIAKNPEYAQLVQAVDTGTHDWLAFDLSVDDQVDLFCRGVTAAVDFLDDFDWQEYLEVRKAFDVQRARLKGRQFRKGRPRPWQAEE
ncbi:MAG: patatin-like phospholipase family protein [Pseudomonadota bacterium]